jgi:hypothetical protein
MFDGHMTELFAETTRRAAETGPSPLKSAGRKAVTQHKLLSLGDGLPKAVTAGAIFKGMGFAPRRRLAVSTRFPPLAAWLV